jgi:ketosteroid isomerase-like protein
LGEDAAVSESDRATQATVNELYTAYAGHDFRRVAEMLHENIDWIIYGPVEVFPFAGLRRGRIAVLQAIGTIAEFYSLQRHAIDVMIVNGDRAAVMADVSFKQRATDRTLRFRVANFLRIENGQLIEFREFADSFDQVEQAVGHAVAL